MAMFDSEESTVAGSILKIMSSTANAGAQLAVGAESVGQANDFADMLGRAGADEAAQVGRERTRRAGQIIAELTASGVRSTSGTPLQLLADNAFEASLDRARVEFSFALRAARAEAEGKANLLSGIAGAFNAISAIPTVLGQIPITPGIDPVAAASPQLATDLGNRLDQALEPAIAIDPFLGKGL
jgi:hypothetical protein